MASHYFRGLRRLLVVVDHHESRVDVYPLRATNDKRAAVEAARIIEKRHRAFSNANDPNWSVIDAREVEVHSDNE